MLSELLCLLFPPLFVIFSFTHQPIQIAKKAAQSKQFISEATLEVNKFGIQITNSSGSNFLEWGSPSMLVITKDYYLLASKNKKTLSAHVDLFGSEKTLLRLCLDTYDLPEFYRKDFPQKALSMVLLHQFPMPEQIYAPYREARSLWELADRMFAV